MSDWKDGPLLPALEQAAESRTPLAGLCHRAATRVARLTIENRDLTVELQKLREAVGRMRADQQRYFATRDAHALAHAKVHEAQVDQLLSGQQELL